jgi:hypothetical protein
MLLEKIDLHDAILKTMAIDYAAKSITISIDFYENDDDHSRKSGLINFEGVESLSQVGNFLTLKEHASIGGHVNEWIPAQKNGTTYIDLVGGYIAINSKRVRFRPEE